MGRYTHTLAGPCLIESVIAETARPLWKARLGLSEFHPFNTWIFNSFLTVCRTRQEARRHEETMRTCQQAVMQLDTVAVEEVWPWHRDRRPTLISTRQNPRRTFLCSSTESVASTANRSVELPRRCGTGPGLPAPILMKSSHAA